MTHPTNVPVTELPEPVRSYLTARELRDIDRALSTFSADAEVTDDGSTYRGTAGIRTFLSAAGAEFTYTTELIRAEHVDDGTWIAHQRIEGDFPGGVADLAFRFELSDSLITRLRITA